MVIGSRPHQCSSAVSTRGRVLVPSTVKIITCCSHCGRKLQPSQQSALSSGRFTGLRSRSRDNFAPATKRFIARSPTLLSFSMILYTTTTVRVLNCWHYSLSLQQIIFECWISVNDDLPTQSDKAVKIGMGKYWLIFCHIFNLRNQYDRQN